MKYLISALRHPRDYEWRRLRPWQKHSEVLAVAGNVYLGIGISYLVHPASDTRRAALGVIFDLLPPLGWGCIWATVGVLALASTRWPPASKTWGYTALTGLAALWAAAYAVGVMFDGAPIVGLVGTLIYGLVAYLWYAIAGLSNPDDLYLFQPTTEEPATPDDLEA